MGLTGTGDHDVAAGGGGKGLLGAADGFGVVGADPGVLEIVRAGRNTDGADGRSDHRVGGFRRSGIERALGALLLPGDPE